MGQVFSILLAKRLGDKELLLAQRYRLDSLDDLAAALSSLNFTLEDLGDDVSLQARSVICTYYQLKSRDVYGPFPTSTVGWSLVKRHYVFKKVGFSLFFLHVAQVTLCLFVVLTHLEFYQLYPLLVGFCYVGAKVIQAEKMVLTMTLRRSFDAADRFLFHFPIFQCMRPLVQLGFILMHFAMSVACAVADVTPSMSIHGLFHAGATCLIMICGLANGISTATAFTAITSFVAFRFIADFDNVFVDRMCAQVTVLELVDDIQAQDGIVNYIVLIAGFMWCGCVSCVLALYPLILRLTGVI